MIYDFRMLKEEIKDQTTVNQLSKIEKDGLTMFVMADGRIRGAFLGGTALVNQMRAQHKTGILETYVLGQACLCSALLIPTMKGREHLTFRYETNGASHGFCTEADSTGYVRGYLLDDRIPVEKPLESWDLSPFFGDGTVSISRIGEGMRQAQTGTTDIIFKNIAKDLAYYFQQSEQTQTAFNTSIQMDKEGRVVGAGGMFLQVMPFAGGKRKSAQTSDSGEDSFTEADNDALLSRVEMAFKAMPSIGQWISEGGKREDAVIGLFREFEPKIVYDRSIVFDCPCCEENFVRAIKNMGKAELDDIIAHDKDPIEVTCNHCGSVYHIPKSKLTE